MRSKRGKSSSWIRHLQLPSSTLLSSIHPHSVLFHAFSRHLSLPRHSLSICQPTISTRH
jgi:hypothetical protein